MGKIQPPKPSLLFSAVTFNPLVSKDLIENRLSSTFGEIIVKSELFPFDFTNYYEEEMGKNLLKFLLGFNCLLTEEHLPTLKLKSDKLEKEFSDEFGNRKVNIDPGFLSESRVVLASTKNFSHRIYLGKGIFGEITLLYQNKKFICLPWTFPDYKSSKIQDFLFLARGEYVKILKGGKR